MRVGELLLFLLVTLGGMFTLTQAHADVCFSGVFNSQEAEKIVAGSVTLINEIIRNPKAANMRNWERLSNPHDETEVAFFANSISDGTDAVYTSDMVLKRRIERHSRSQTDLAVVLQYLRLSLLAFSSQPGKKSPSITVSEIFHRGDRSEIAARGHFNTYGSDGKLVQHPIEVEFDIDVRTASNGNKNGFCLNLSSIVVGEWKVFGWWHDL